MKRLLFTLILLISTHFSFSQISITKIKKNEEDKTVKTYDSLQNHPRYNQLDLLIGQDLFVKPVKEGGFPGREMCYSGFYEDIDMKKIYEKNNGYLDNSEYDSLSGKYFKVLDVTKKSYDLFIFKLQESESKEIIYWKGENHFVEESVDHPSFFYFDFPFITVGFYEKLKERSVNQRYIMGNTYWRFWGENVDINSGKKVDHHIGEEWKCVDVTISEPNFKLSLVLVNDKNEKLVVDYDRIIVNENRKGNEDEYPDKKVFTKENFETYKFKLGDVSMMDILEGKIWIGMTEEMCKLSWGEPININETMRNSGVSEQWIYEDTYVYFDDGILTTIQD